MVYILEAFQVIDVFVSYLACQVLCVSVAFPIFAKIFL